MKASDGTRTRDLLITNQSLYQLSHRSLFQRTEYHYTSFSTFLQLFFCFFRNNFLARERQTMCRERVVAGYCTLLMILLI